MGDRQRRTVDRDVAFLNNVREVGCRFFRKLEDVSQRIAIGCNGLDFGRGIDVALVLAIRLEIRALLTWTMCPPNRVCPAIALSQLTVLPSLSVPVVRIRRYKSHSMYPDLSVSASHLPN